MEMHIKKLLTFCVKDPERILITPCSLKQAEWYPSLLSLKSVEEIRCTATDCEEEENCTKMNPEGLFLPFKRFDAWILDIDSFPYSPGYAFYLGYQTLKDFGVIAVIHGNEELDPVALTYGFQILYHGEWIYYLKAGKSVSQN